MPSWFDTSFAWIGLAGAVVLLLLLFGTDALRSDRARSRWRDLTWLSWAGATAYLLHNAEEYGLDLLGHTYAFPTSVCGLFGFRVGVDCPVPPTFFTLVNVPTFWLSGPVAALLSRRHPLVGLAIYSVISVNFAAHVISGLVTGTVYNPGWLTAVLLFLPLTLWTTHTLLRTGELTHGGLVFLVGWGVILHATLAASLLPLMKGLVENALPAIVIQVLDAMLLIVVPLVAERWRGGILLRARSHS